MRSAPAATRRIFLLSLSLLVPCVAAAAPPITTESLLSDYTDLRALAEFPDPAYTTRQFSSYDRASTSPKNPDTWFANDDRAQFLRAEPHAGRTEHVLMDAPGPGAVVSIWSASPAGTLRVYLDGEPTPALEAPMADLLSGKVPGLPAPLAAVTSRGYNLYFPIPYAASCKITSDDPNFYYHVDYRTYPPGTPVTTFTPADLKTLAPQITALAKQLASPRDLPPPAAETRPFNLTLPPGQTTTLAALTGPKAISEIVINPVSAGEDRPSLRNVVLRITFDGRRTVETPLADFFGAGPAARPYSSLPLGITSSGELYSHWFMPFRDSAKLELVNLSPTPIPLAGRLSLTPHAWTDRSMHFHAAYHAAYDVPTVPHSDRTHLDTTGRGLFAGIALTIDSPVRRWWGEGDEKIYVDGETFPSFFGTGTEDYFGYAWCSPDLFSHAYHAQPQCDGPGNYGRTSINRFHIPDRIPFTRSFKFDLELWHWIDCKVNLATTTYWYAIPSDASSLRHSERSEESQPPDPAVPSLAAADLVVRPIPPYVPPSVPGAIEAESMTVLAHTAGRTELRYFRDDSGDQHLWWHAAPHTGDTLRLSFPAPAAGRYHVLAHFLKGLDYAQAQLAINGTSAGQPLDFYNPRPASTPELDLGTFDLHPGPNELTITLTGRNPLAKPGHTVSLDYLLLKPTTPNP